MAEMGGGIFALVSPGLPPAFGAMADAEGAARAGGLLEALELESRGEDHLGAAVLELDQAPAPHGVGLEGEPALVFG